MPVFAKASNQRECKGRFASENEEEDGGRLIKEQKEHLHNGEGKSFGALKKCMRDITHQIPLRDHKMIYKVNLEDSLG